VAAVLALVAAVAPFRLDTDAEAEGLGGLIAVVLVVALVLAAMTLGYAHSGWPQWVAVVAVVGFFVLGVVTGWASFYLYYAAAMAMGLAMAAGAPLPPNDPRDARLSTPFRREEPD
jgi:hypothetical protein